MERRVGYDPRDDRNAVGVPRRRFLVDSAAALLSVGAVGLFGQCARPPRGDGGAQRVEILMFDLIHAAGSPEAMRFVAEAKELANLIPLLSDLEIYRQQSESAEEYQYCLLFSFLKEEDYALFEQHPAYRRFYNERWETEVMRFKRSHFMKM